MLGGREGRIHGCPALPRRWGMQPGVRAAHSAALSHMEPSTGMHSQCCQLTCKVSAGCWASAPAGRATGEDGSGGGGLAAVLAPFGSGYSSCMEAALTHILTSSMLSPCIL